MRHTLQVGECHPLLIGRTGNWGLDEHRSQAKRVPASPGAVCWEAAVADRLDAIKLAMTSWREGGAPRTEDLGPLSHQWGKEEAVWG